MYHLFFCCVLPSPHPRAASNGGGTHKTKMHRRAYRRLSRVDVLEVKIWQTQASGVRSYFKKMRFKRDHFTLCHVTVNNMHV